MVLSWPGFSPMSGCAFVFFLPYQKKLAKGRFRELVYKGSDGCLQASYEEIYFLMRGLSPVTMKADSRFRYDVDDI